MKKKRLNLVNLIKLIILVGCLLIPISDVLKIFYYSFKGMTVGFSWYGIIIDLMLLFTFELIYDDLFGGN